MSDALAKLAAWFALPCKDDIKASLANIIHDLEPQLIPVWHPLGFIHTKLAQGQAGETFRLHVWSTDDRDSQEQRDKIHDHLFDIHSRVISGSIKNVQYNFVPNDEGEFRVMRVAYRPSNSQLRETGQLGNLEPTGEVVHSAPAEYFVRQFELHETMLPVPGHALTVVHTTHAAEYEPRAIFQRNSPNPPMRAPVPCNRELWRNLLWKMLSI